MQDTDLMLHTLLELGESMLADGADVRRVEQTLSRMGKAYGAVRMDVFVITSSIVLTMCFADGSAATQTRRIEKTAVTDFGKLEAINAISRSYCEHPFPVPELYDRLQLAKRCEPARWKLFAGSCLAAGALAVFFGGTAPKNIPRSLSRGRLLSFSARSQSFIVFDTPAAQKPQPHPAFSAHPAGLHPPGWSYGRRASWKRGLQYPRVFPDAADRQSFPLR